MDDIRVQEATLRSRMIQCEKEATEHEQTARALRAERQECKVKLSEIALQVNQLVQQEAARLSAVSAAKSSQDVEAMKKEAADVLESLKAKSAELDAKLAAINAPKV